MVAKANRKKIEKKQKTSVKVTFDLDLKNAALLKDVEERVKEDFFKNQGIRLSRVNKESLLNYCISTAHTALKLGKKKK